MRLLRQMDFMPGEGEYFGGLEPGEASVQAAIQRTRDAIAASRVREESRRRGLQRIRAMGGNHAKDGTAGSAATGEESGDS